MRVLLHSGERVETISHPKRQKLIFLNLSIAAL
jgi:hypothetical protein